MNKNLIQSIWWAIWFGLLLTSIVVYIVAPEYGEFILGVFVASKIIFLTLLYINRNPIIAFLKTTLFKNLVSNSITIFLVMAILGMVNYLGVKNNIQFDLTKQKVHTLSEQSKTILGGLEAELKITLFARRINWDRFLNLINLYKFHNEKVKVEVIDIDTNPSMVQLNGVKEDGTVILTYKGNKTSTVAKDELTVTNSMIKLLRTNKIVVYYTVGHNEIDRALKDQNGGSYLFNKMIGANYIVKPLDLLKVADIPGDANLVLLLGPQQGFLDLEIEKLERYMSKGGNLLVTLAPNFTDTNFDNLYLLLQKYGIKVTNSIVLDRLSTVQGSQATIPIVTLFNPNHSITKKFKGKVLMPLSAALQDAKVENKKYDVLMKSNSFPGSWAETSFEEVKTGRATYDAKDLKGPIHLFSVAEDSKNHGRLMVSSSSSFIVNGYQSQSANFNFFLNALAWGLDDEGIIGLNRPSLENERIILSASQLTLIFYFAIGFIPFVLFAVAIYFYRRRLKK